MALSDLILPTRGERESSINFPSNSKQVFTFTRENICDKFFKLIGFASEFQTANSTFNEKIYIAADCKKFCQDVDSNLELQTLILNLFNLGIETIECDGKKIFARYHLSRLAGSRASVVIKFTLRKINRVLKTLPSSNLPIDPVTKSWLEFYSRSKKRIYLIILTTLLCSFPVTITQDGLLKYSLSYSIPLFVIFSISSTKKFFRTSRAHLALFINFSITLPVSIIFIYCTMLYMNIIFDHSEKQIYYQTVIDKKEIHGTRHSSYQVITREGENKDARHQLLSSDDLYNKVRIGSVVKISIKKGFLGYSWVENEEVFAKQTRLIPDDWIGRELDSKEGYCWYNPVSTDNSICIYRRNQPGTNKQQDYMVYYKDGKAVVE